MPLPSQRALFDLPRDVAYLNCAYMSPLLTSAVLAGQHGLARKARPWEITPAEFSTGPEELRGLYGEVLGVSGEDVALVPSVSYGMALAAANLPLRAGQTIVIPAEEFPSGVHVWRRRARETGAAVVTVPRPDDGDWTAALLGAIDARTAVVCTSQVHWVCGGAIDLVAIGAAVKAASAALVVDLTQSITIVDPAIAAADPDFVVAAGYKWLMGPYALGLLYVAPRHHRGTPLEEGWMARVGAEDFARLVDYQEAFAPGARRFDVGERSNFALVPAAIAACRQVLAWGRPALAETLAAFTAEIVARTRAFGADALDARFRAPHYLGLRFRGGLPSGLPRALAAEGVFVSVRGDRLRVTPHVYNDAVDVERFVAALGRALG